jgi:DNA invertase Pin-like site-specific DNA recombinase
LVERNIIEVLAEFERELIVERTRDGLQAARLKGKRVGRSPIDKEKLESAIKLVEAGLSPTRAAKQVSISGFVREGTTGPSLKVINLLLQ